MLITIERLNGVKVVFKYYYNDHQTFSHIMEYPETIHPSDEALFRISLFSRPANSDSVEVIGVTVNNETKAYFQRSLNASINVSISDEPPYENNVIESVPDDIYLCFSGGFDSITSKALLEDSANLVSIDFGGIFERESLFFRNFDTNIVKWELRGQRPGESEIFNEALDWHWMLSPALLFQVENKPFAIATGTILESAGPWWFSGFKHPEFKRYDGCGFGGSVALINPVACLTEFATTLIASQYLSPDELQLSLKSLAAPKSLKAFRKKVLLSIVQGDNVPDAPWLMKRHRFGAGFTDDFMALYFYWKFGKDWVLSNYVNILPEGVDNIDMSFAEKAHQYNLEYCDAILREDLISKLKTFDVEIYTASDYLEVEKVKAIISP